MTPVSRTPFLAAVGKPFDGLVAKGGQVCVQKRVKIGFTFDHRYIDGYHGAKLLRYFTKVFEAPDRYVSVFFPNTKSDDSGVEETTSQPASGE